MLKIKISNIMIIFLLLFIVLDFIGYKYLINSIKTTHLKNEEILFYKLQRETNELLTYLLYKYSHKKDILEAKHKEVINYFKNNKYNKNLDSLYEQINKGYKNKPFNIYITDENLKIVNTTFSPDLGFDLSFAKKTFIAHKNKKIIGISAPIFETYSKNFFSYSDCYLPNTNRILQLSYRYDNTKEKIKKIQAILEKNRIVLNSNAYISFKDGYIGDFIFKSFKAYKPNLEKIKNRLKNGGKLFNKLENKKFYIENKKEYKTYYFIQKSTLFDDAKIMHRVVFDNKELNKKLANINIIVIILSIIGFFTIIALFRIRNQEIILTQKDKFIKHSVHEIKTPLSIISLNNQLRDKKFGKDRYSVKIDSAIKTLENSYEDMSYLLTKNKITYEKENINIGSFLEKRVIYFQSIAKAQGREIFLNEIETFDFFISEIELTRLIDNNLSNAIKYSNIHSKINVTLKNKKLSFISEGKEIKNKKTIFKKYERESNEIGGHGLGLSIVKDITKDYRIKIVLSRKDHRNIFSYDFV